MPLTAEQRFNQLVASYSRVYRPNQANRRRWVCAGVFGVGLIIAALVFSIALPPRAILPISVGPLVGAVALARFFGGVWTARVAAVAAVCITSAVFIPESCVWLSANDAFDYRCHQIDATVLPWMSGYALAVIGFTLRA